MSASATVSVAPARRRRAALDVAETALTNALLGVIGIVTGVLAARWLGPDGRGELAAIQLWPSVLASAATIGLPEALVFISAKHASESRRFLTTAILIAGAVMPPAILVGYVLIPRLLTMHPDRIVQAARAYLILVPLYGLVGLPHQLLRGMQRYRLWNAIRLIPPLLWLAVLTISALLRITDPVRMTSAHLSLLACAGPAVVWIVVKHSYGAAAPTLATASSLLKFGLPSALATLPQFVNLKLDQMMVASVVPARELGVYMVAVAWGSCIPLLSSALATIVSTKIAAGTDSERSRRFILGVRGAAWLILAPVVLLSATAPVTIPIVFGSAFQTAIVPATILVFASGANALNGVLEELLRGCGCPGATLVAETTAAGVSVPVLLILLPRAGLTGAAMGSLMGYLAATIVLLRDSRRIAGLSMVGILNPRAI